MKLVCDKCQRTYIFPDKGIKALFYAGGAHTLLPIGQTLGCDGILRPTVPLPSAEIDFRAIVRKHGEDSNTSEALE